MFPSQNTRIFVDLGGDMVCSRKGKDALDGGHSTLSHIGAPCQIGSHCIPILLKKKNGCGQSYLRTGRAGRI